jgi:hypothetical protein
MKYKLKKTKFLNVFPHILFFKCLLSTITYYFPKYAPFLSKSPLFYAKSTGQYLPLDFF